jgi:hypothetical protein
MIAKINIPHTLYVYNVNWYPAYSRFYEFYLEILIYFRNLYSFLVTSFQ